MSNAEITEIAPLFGTLGSYSVSPARYPSNLLSPHTLSHHCYAVVANRFGAQSLTMSDTTAAVRLTSPSPPTVDATLTTADPRQCSVRFSTHAATDNSELTR